MKKTKLYFNKPVHLGMSILDLSKSFMYDYHYNYIKTKYGITQNYSSPTLTLSHNPDVEERFDTSDYPTNHPSGIKTGLNSKVLGMFKDEASGKQTVEFVGFRANLYSYKMLDDKKVRE